MPVRGLKRKLCDSEEMGLEGDEPFHPESYAIIRQTLFNLSVDKFNKGRTMVEPSLRRYVLIANTLRIIQEEMRRDVFCAGPWADAAFSDSQGPPPGDAVSLGAEMENRLSFLPEDLANLNLPLVDEDFSVSSAIATIMKELENVLNESCPQFQQRVLGSQDADGKAAFTPTGGPPALAQTQPRGGCTDSAKAANSNPAAIGDGKDIELLSQLVLAASCTGPIPELPVATETPELETPAETRSDAPVPMDTSEEPAGRRQAPSASVGPSEGLKAAESLFGSFEVMNSTYLNDISFDDLFSDIDTSVFERDSLLVSNTTTTRLPAPEDVWIQSYCNAPSYGMGKGHRESNDLDSIMEILVGS
ncbi:SERTA domain-containing protein 2-like [Spea bombifrons]|uniref:SERTA domain-containing protein 2-like n=1 Tax=Spea bombifrons TaxID=233779 RepID=UPI0023498FB4|nr:SERTA domain-containing protein 2-like [Spea bombifrons]